MSIFTDNLKQASFRGVPFHVSENSRQTGRRIQTHEFPGGERPATEDLGRSARRISINGFVIGPDWQAKRDALLDALEKKGAGELVLPSGDSEMVFADPSCECREDTALFRATFALVFVEAGAAPKMSAYLDLSVKVKLAADALDSANAGEFEAKFRLPASGDDLNAVIGAAKNLCDTVKDIIAEGQTYVNEVQGTINTMLEGVDEIVAAADNIADLANSAQLILNTPGVFAARFKAAADILASILPPTNGSCAAVLNVGSVGNAGVDASTPPHSEANARLRAFSLAGTLSQASRVLTNVQFERASDAQALLASFLGAADSILGADFPMQPEFTAAVSNMAAAATAFINDAILDAPEESVITLTATTPARALAWELYADPSRADEICKANGIRHSGFLPTGVALEVLKK